MFYFIEIVYARYLKIPMKIYRIKRTTATTSFSIWIEFRERKKKKQQKNLFPRQRNEKKKKKVVRNIIVSFLFLFWQAESCTTIS